VGSRGGGGGANKWGATKKIQVGAHPCQSLVRVSFFFYFFSFLFRQRETQGKMGGNNNKKKFKSAHILANHLRVSLSFFIFIF
jgi:hypothetical protein